MTLWTVAMGSAPITTISRFLLTRKALVRPGPGPNEKNWGATGLEGEDLILDNPEFDRQMPYEATTRRSNEYHQLIQLGVDDVGWSLQLT